MGFKIGKIKTGIKFLDKKANKAISNTASLYGQKDPLKAPSPGAPGEDPALTALRNKTYQEANQFRQDMPGLMKEQENILETDAHRASAQGVRGERKAFNDRGLLYSGMRQGAEADVKSRVASGLAKSTADSRKGFEDTARAKENVAAQVGLAGYQEALRMAQDVYNLQAEKNTQNRQQMQQLGQAGGYAAGTYSAGGFSRQGPQQPTPTYYDRYSQWQPGQQSANNYGQGLMA